MNKDRFKMKLSKLYKDLKIGKDNNVNSSNHLTVKQTSFNGSDDYIHSSFTKESDSVKIPEIIVSPPSPSPFPQVSTSHEHLNKNNGNCSFAHISSGSCVKSAQSVDLEDVPDTCEHEYEDVDVLILESVFNSRNDYIRPIESVYMNRVCEEDSEEEESEDSGEEISQEEISQINTRDVNIDDVNINNNDNVIDNTNNNNNKPNTIKPESNKHNTFKLYFTKNKQTTTNSVDNLENDNEDEDSRCCWITSTLQVLCNLPGVETDFPRYNCMLNDAQRDLFKLLQIIQSDDSTLEEIIKKNENDTKLMGFLNNINTIINTTDTNDKDTNKDNNNNNNKSSDNINNDNNDNDNDNNNNDDDNDDSNTKNNNSCTVNPTSLIKTLFSSVQDPFIDFFTGISHASNITSKGSSITDNMVRCNYSSEFARVLLDKVLVGTRLRSRCQATILCRDMCTLCKRKSSKTVMKYCRFFPLLLSKEIREKNHFEINFIDIMRDELNALPVFYDNSLENEQDHNENEKDSENNATPTSESDIPCITLNNEDANISINSNDDEIILSDYIFPTIFSNQKTDFTCNSKSCLSGDGQHHHIVRYTTFVHLPEVLVFSIVRDGTSTMEMTFNPIRRERCMKRSLNRPIRIPMEIDMGAHVHPEYRNESTSTFYKLHGFVTQKDGRYIAYTHISNNYQWYKIDDSKIIPIDLLVGSFPTEGVSLLFYVLQVKKHY